MTNLNKKYKDKDPIETINIVKKFFEEKNFEIKEDIIYKTLTNTYWCGIKLYYYDINILKANGKGATEFYALASGYAELYERFCAKMQYYLNPFLFQNYFNVYNKDNNLTIDQLLEDKIVEEFFISFFNKNLNDFSNYLNLFICDNQSQIPGQYFTNIVTNKRQLFNPTFITLFNGSNGLSAGNSLEEALIQGISEWFERYVMYQTIINKQSLYYVDKKILPKYLQELIENLESNTNQKIYLIDLSYNYNLPVTLVLIIDLINYKFYYSYASAPTFSISIERCLTELYQGMTNEQLENMNNPQVPFNSLKWEDIPMMIKISASLEGRAACPFELSDLIEVQEYNKTIFLEDKNYTNEQFLQHYQILLKRNNIDLYYKDISLTKDFYAIRVYSPNKNNYLNHLATATNNIIKNKEYMNIAIQIYCLFYEIINNKTPNHLNLYYFLQTITKIKNYSEKDFSNLNALIKVLPLICPFSLTDFSFDILYNDSFTTKKWNNTDVNLFCLIYNYLKNGYTSKEIQTILKHFDIIMSENQIEQFSSYEYLLSKTIFYILHGVYNDGFLKDFINTMKRE